MVTLVHKVHTIAQSVQTSLSDALLLMLTIRPVSLPVSTYLELMLRSCLANGNTKLDLASVFQLEINFGFHATCSVV
jgi:hypothetical protein